MDEGNVVMVEWIQGLLAHLPSGSELVGALPVIASLIIIEGLLSVDNAMAIASMASALPKHQQKKALLWGMAGAYVFRGVCLFIVGWIANNMWVKAIGALYLIYLMASHLRHKEADDKELKVSASFFLTILQIELMDLSLSVDNVVAAVALDKRLWVVITGVFIGILALRFLAGYCITLIEKHPILKQTAFLLIGFVGVILMTEQVLEYVGIRFHIESWQKFIGIAVIISATLAYEKYPKARAAFSPAVFVGKPLMALIDNLVGYALVKPLSFVGGLLLVRPLKWIIAAVFR